MRDVTVTGSPVLKDSAHKEKLIMYNVVDHGMMIWKRFLGKLRVS